MARVQSFMLCCLLFVCCCFSGYQADVNSGSGCCLKNQYEVKAAGKYVGPKGKLSLFYMPRFSIDFTKQIAAFQELVDGTNASYIIDYRRQVMYVFVTEARYCKQMPYKESLVGPCIPKDAHFIWQRTLGYGDDSLKFDVYYMDINKSGVSSKVYISVTSEGCYPISESITTQLKEGVTSTDIQYTDFSPGIKDPSVFNIPSFCDNAKIVDTIKTPAALLYK